MVSMAAASNPAVPTRVMAVTIRDASVRRVNPEAMRRAVGRISAMTTVTGATPAAVEAACKAETQAPAATEAAQAALMAGVDTRPTSRAEAWAAANGVMSQSGGSGMPYGSGGQSTSGERQNHRGRGPKDYKRSDDRIKEDVNDRITDDYFLDASDISVEVSDQEVTLSGTVQSRWEKRRAEDWRSRSAASVTSRTFCV